MINIRKKIYKVLIAGIALFAMPSCTDYLDKAPEADLSDQDAFKDFRSFQGFTEELYRCVPDFAKGYWTNSFNWGEDEIINVGIDYHFGYKIDLGDFWGWQSEFDGWQSGFMDRSDFRTEGDRFSMSLWKGAWYGISKCNYGLAHLDMMTEATTEERNLVKGQLLFFRGWFHFQLMQYFGGLPYIDEVLDSNQQLRLPRLSYAECADKAAADFREAADLLPVNWDNTSAGANTMGNNDLRINKIMALGYLGKNYLWAGSPLMNGDSTGSYTYNTDYCSKAAEAFGELLTLVEGGKTMYALQDFSDIASVFYTKGKNNRMPGGTEAIFRSLSNDGWQPSAYNQGKCYAPKFMNTESPMCFLPTANYVNYYGMANGLPLDDPESGFDPTHPWKDRDPRFYQDIGYDGAIVVRNEQAADNIRYASLSTNGDMRDVILGSRTGYILLKFTGIGMNSLDKDYEWSPQYHLHVPYMRLADIYLMYAESAAVAGNGSSGKSSNFSKSALDAVNVIRERAGVGAVNPKYSGSLEGFLSELRRERAVELSYESHRFNDLRRWRLLDKYPYNIKTSQEFTRDPGFDPKTTDSKEGKVIGWSEKEILRRNFSEKHYWLPLKRSDAFIYAEFAQNPGW